MKTNTIIALAAGAAILACIKKRKSTSGVGNVMIPGKIVRETRRLIKAYDDACEIEREHSAKSDAIFDELEAQGIDWHTEDGERIAQEILFREGLADENGETDVYVNRSNARRELLNHIYNNLLPIFPLPKNDIKLMAKNRIVTIEDRLLDITRKFIGA